MSRKKKNNHVRELTVTHGGKCAGGKVHACNVIKRTARCANGALKPRSRALAQSRARTNGTGSTVCPRSRWIGWCVDTHVRESRIIPKGIDVKTFLEQLN